MSRPLQHHPLPVMWRPNTAAAELVRWRLLGYSAVVQRQPVHVATVDDLPELWRWFDPADDPHWLPVETAFGCPRCPRPRPVALLNLIRDEPGRAEPVAVITYRFPWDESDASQVTQAAAVLHLPDLQRPCHHGPLLCHPTDPPVSAHCERHGEVVIRWDTVTDEIRRFGGWRVSSEELTADGPRRRRVVRAG